MFTDSKSLSFLPVLAPKIVLINYSLFGSKTLLFLGIIFGNLFIAVREKGTSEKEDAGVIEGLRSLMDPCFGGGRGDPEDGDV